MITETDRLTHALDVAAAIYPELDSNRGALLRRVLDVGIDAVLAHDTQVANTRKQRILELSQQMSGVWPENWREERLAPIVEAEPRILSRSALPRRLSAERPPLPTKDCARGHSVPEKHQPRPRPWEPER